MFPNADFHFVDQRNASMTYRTSLLGRCSGTFTQSKDLIGGMFRSHDNVGGGVGGDVSSKSQ